MAVPLLREGRHFSVQRVRVTGCLAIVTGQRVPESLIDTLVDQNAHLGTCEQKVFCFFESSDGRFTRDGGKSLQKVFECFSALEVIDKRLDGHSRSAKDGSSAENIRIFDDYAHEGIVIHARLWGARGRQRGASGWRKLKRANDVIDEMIVETGSRGERGMLSGR